MKKVLSAIALIKQDHRAIEKMYRKYKVKIAKPKNRELFAGQICSALEAHAKMEEKYFYPAVQEGTTAKGDFLIVEAYAEHLGMKALIKVVKSIPEGTARMTMMDALMRIVKLHVKEEEREILPMAQEVLSETRLMDLGMKMAPFSPSERDKANET